MSKQFQNSQKNMTRSLRLNLQMQNPYQAIYNDQFSSFFSALKGAKTEKEAQDLVRHLGMLYNTLGIAIKDLVKIIGHKFHQEKQQKIQSSSKSKSSDIVIQVTYIHEPVEQQEGSEKINEKRQQLHQNEFRAMAQENQEPNQQSSKSMEFNGKPNPFKNLLPENHVSRNHEKDEENNGGLYNSQKSYSRQDLQKFPSLSEVLRQKIIGEKKVQSPVSKKQKMIENLQSDESNQSNVNELRNNGLAANQSNNQTKNNDFTQIGKNGLMQDIKASEVEKQSKPNHHIESQQKNDFDNLLKQFEFKTFPSQKNSSKLDRNDHIEGKNSKVQTKASRVQPQLKDSNFMPTFPAQKNSNTVLTREQTRKINSSKTPKVYQIISLDDDDQQWLQNPQPKTFKTTLYSEQNIESEEKNKKFSNNRLENEARFMDNYNSSMKKKFRGQQLGMVCSFCNKFFQNGTNKQNSCQCKRLQSRCQENEIIAKQICLSDQQ